MFQEDETEANLTGNLFGKYGGTPIEESDSICIVPQATLGWDIYQASKVESEIT